MVSGKDDTTRKTGPNGTGTLCIGRNDSTEDSDWEESDDCNDLANLDDFMGNAGKPDVPDFPRATTIPQLEPLRFPKRGNPIMTHTTIPAYSQVDGSPLYCVTLSGKAMCIGCANHGRRLGCTQDDDNPDWFLVELRPHLGGETCHHCRRKIHITPKRDAIPLVMRDELESNGYTAILGIDDSGIRIRKDDGGIDVFQVRDSFAGWCLDTSDGRVLEFCYSTR